MIYIISVPSSNRQSFLWTCSLEEASREASSLLQTGIPPVNPDVSAQSLFCQSELKESCHSQVVNCHQITAEYSYRIFVDTCIVVPFWWEDVCYALAALAGVHSHIVGTWGCGLSSENVSMWLLVTHCTHHTKTQSFSDPRAGCLISKAEILRTAGSSLLLPKSVLALKLSCICRGMIWGSQEPWLCLIKYLILNYNAWYA